MEDFLLGLPLPKGRPLILVRSIMDSVNFLNLMDNFEAGKEGEREKEREHNTDYTRKGAKKGPRSVLIRTCEEECALTLSKSNVS